MDNSNKFLGELEQFAEEFAEASLRNYIGRLNNDLHIPKEPKEINDSVWGTIKLSKLEVVIIDSPLLQRLRLIRQLGVVHWVYPGASHSRFEHTLGVLHQSQRLIQAINQSSGAEPISANKASLVRLCAVLHDIGHCVFSHVSEHAISRNKEVSIALQNFARKESVESVQLSEAFAYNVVGSAAFKELLATALDKLGEPIILAKGSIDNAAAISESIQKAIIGHHIDEAVPLLHEIITGPFDADKLDYYTRDAKHAGVPSVLDISRLIQKITAKETSPRDLPPHLGKILSTKQERHWLFGLKASGASLLDELHLTRVLLYAKIYRHKKVQAIEAMIDGLFESLATNPGIEPIQLVKLAYNTADDQLLSASADWIFNQTGVMPEPNLLKFVEKIIVRLRERNLYVSALALRDGYDEDRHKANGDQQIGLSDIISACKNPQLVIKFRKNLIAQIKQLVSIQPGAIGNFDPNYLDYALSIASKGQPGSGTTIDRALIYQGDKFVRGRDLDQSNKAALVPAIDFGHPSVTIFCPKEVAAAVYVAAERLFWNEYRVIFPRCALSHCKQSSGDVDKIRESLLNSNWYDGVPLELRPLPERLRRQDIQNRVEQIAANLIQIDEPYKLEAPDNQLLYMSQRIMDWLAHFGTTPAIEGALCSLEHFKVLDRKDSQDALTSFVSKNPEFEKAIICPLGKLKDSGSVQGYLAADGKQVFTDSMTFEEAAKRGGSEPIIIIDDFIGSGGQIQDMLGNWFDEDDLKKATLGEERLPFSAIEQDFFRSRNIAFVFVAGWNDGKASALKALKKLDSNAQVFIHMEDDTLPFVDSTKENERAFLDRASEIGKALIASNGKDVEKQKTRNLGYGNRAMLLSSRLNVPTQTLSCIWMEGEFDGIRWQPLINRRKKD